MAYKTGDVSPWDMDALLDNRAILPNRRLPHLLAVIGDSRMDPAILSGFQKGGGSQVNYACALSHQRYRLVLDYGASGQTTAQYLNDTNINAIIASNCGTVGIMGCLNDVTANITGAVAAANVIAAAERFRRAGLNVWLEAELGQNGMTLARFGECTAYNQTLKEYAERTPGVYWHDARPVLCDLGASAIANLFKTGMTYDGTHSSQRGSYYWGKSLKVLLDSFIPANASPAINSPFDLPANGRWQILDNPLFNTTSGGSTSTGVTGTIPGSCTANKTGAGTSVAITPAAQSVAMAITFGAQSDNARMSMAANNANWSQGDWLIGLCRVTVTNPSGLAGTQFTMVATGDSVGTNVTDLAVTPTWTGPDETHSLTMMTLPFQVPAYASKGSLVPTVYAYANAAGSAFTMTVEQMAIARRIGGY